MEILTVYKQEMLFRAAQYFAIDGTWKLDAPSKVVSPSDFTMHLFSCFHLLSFS